MEKRVLILSESFGVGHTKIAEAVKAGLLLLEPNWEVELIELGALLKPNLNNLIVEFYLKTLRYSPNLWGKLYKRVQNKKIKPEIEFILHKTLYTRVLRLIEIYRPDLIITTHPFPGAVISRLKRAGLGIPLHTVITDYGAHGSWISSNVDYYYIPSEQSKELFLKLGVNESKIRVTGIPVHPKFWIKNDKKNIREKLQLNNIPTVLYMGGGLGLGLTNDVLKKLNKLRDNIQLIIITGHNQKLYTSLQENPYFKHPNIKILGFVDNIDQLMDASDILITKPGGATIAEAIAKRIPTFLLNPIPGQEEDNYSYLVYNNLALSISKFNEIEVLINEMVKKPDFFANFMYIDLLQGNKTVEELIKNIYF